MAFIAMLALQVAGALVLLLNNINGSREAVIRSCFPGSNIVKRDNDNNCVLPCEKLQRSAHAIYLNIVAFDWIWNRSVQPGVLVSTIYECCFGDCVICFIDYC